jgi:hypothetical protein
MPVWQLPGEGNCHADTSHEPQSPFCGGTSSAAGAGLNRGKTVSRDRVSNAERWRVASSIVLHVLVWSQLTAAVTPPPVGQSAAPITLTLRLADGRTEFRPGEVITLELEFASAVPKRFTVDGATYDRSGRLTIDEFTIDRIDDVSDPMLDYFASIGGYVGGGIRGTGVLGEQLFTIRLDLNEWFRFDKPGAYTLSVKSRRVTDESVTPHSVLTVESNAISFVILPRDTDWEAAELDRARSILAVKSPPPGARPGCRMMRYLGTDAAAAEMIRHYGRDTNDGCDFEYMAGLFSAPNRAAVVLMMEEGLRAPDRPITRSYLRTQATLSVYLQNPELRPAATRETKGRLIAGGDLSKRPDLIDAAVTVYSEMLAAAMLDKTDRARAITLAEGLGLPGGPSPATAAASPSRIADQLAAAFLDLPAERQATLLGLQWRTVAGPAMIPALRRVVDAPSSNEPSVPDLALRRLAQLAPEEARPLILREIQHPRRGATLKTLGSLPDAELPELDDVLASNFEASNSEINAALVQRYATKKIEPRILAAAGEQIGRMACSQQSSILAYVLRIDAAESAELLDRAMASRVTGCWRSLNQIADAHMSPALEKRAIADLDNADPDAVIGAIQTLGRHGSPGALEPLRAAFQRWHATWSGRQEELTYSHAVERPNARQAMVEDAFRQAIGAGENWLLRPSDVRELQSFCVTDGCRTQTRYMIHDDDTRIMLWAVSEPDESNIELAQYRFTSLTTLEAKLALFPRGTTFTVARADQAGDVSAAITALKAFASAHSLTVRER